jgi:hypothetical protein
MLASINGVRHTTAAFYLWDRPVDPDEVFSLNGDFVSGLGSRIVEFVKRKGPPEDRRA